MTPRLDPLADLVAMSLAQPNFEGSAGLTDDINDRCRQFASRALAGGGLASRITAPEYERFRR